MYYCSKCDHEAKNKRSAIWHYLRLHTPKERVPFSCSLCGYVAMTRKQLESHIKGYQNHIMRRMTVLATIPDNQFFQMALHPYTVTVGSNNTDILTKKMTKMAVSVERNTIDEKKVEENVQETEKRVDEEKMEKVQENVDEKIDEEKMEMDEVEEKIENKVEEKTEKKEDVDRCGVTEETLFVPDYEDSASLMNDVCMQTEEMPVFQENRSLGDYIVRLEEKLKRKDREIENLKTQLVDERRKSRDVYYGADGRYGLREFEEMYEEESRRMSPRKKKLKSVIVRV